MNSKIRNYKDLISWQKGHELVILVYKITENFPAEEKFGLVGQMRRAAVSVTSCIAEGFSRKTNKDKLQFYKIATGSLTELDNQLTISRDIHYLKANDYEYISNLINECGKLINGLCQATQQNKYKSYEDS